MSKMIGAPTRYRQGKDELKCLGDDLKDYAKFMKNVATRSLNLT